MSSRPNIQIPALRDSVAAAVLLVIALWPWNLDTFAHNDSAAANKDFIPSPIILSVSAAASSRYVLIAKKDPEDILEDELEDALDDLEDALDDELDEDHPGSGDDFDDDMFERLSELEASLGEDAVDLNHSYAADAASSEDEALAALLAVPVRLAGPLRLAEPLGLLPAGTVGLRIGIIDSGIDLSHRALSSAAIKTRNFVNRGGPLSNAHGTMIAAIISGFEPGAYQGIAPGSEILAANIFFARADGTAVANVEGMILALDWLVGENVPVVNMSVSGPPNRLLRRAIERAAAAGTIVVAAVGNAGPASPPLYPAAYGSVVAVTAIDSSGQIYCRAVRGSHVEFASPGVDVFAASIADARAGVDTGSYELQSGTSLAVPFVVVALAAVRQQYQRPWADILSAFHAEAQDLGEAGFDPVFGYGLIRGIGAASETLYRPAGE